MSLRKTLMIVNKANIISRTKLFSPILFCRDVRRHGTRDHKEVVRTVEASDPNRQQSMSNLLQSLFFWKELDQPYSLFFLLFSLAMHHCLWHTKSCCMAVPSI